MSYLLRKLNRHARLDYWVEMPRKRHAEKTPAHVQGISYDAICCVHKVLPYQLRNKRQTEAPALQGY